MKKLLTSIFFLLLLTATASAQNLLCPNKNPFDSSNACANTRYVDSALSSMLNIPNSALAPMPAGTYKGAVVAGPPIDLTATQATAGLSPYVPDTGAGGTKGLVPAPAAGDAQNGKFYGAGGLTSITGSGVCYVIFMPAGDLSQRINSCISLLGGAGGVVDARGINGNQALGTAISVPAYTHVQLGSISASQTAAVTLSGSGASISGLPAGMGIGSRQSSTYIQQASGANLAAMISSGSAGFNVVTDIQLDGNFANNTSSSACLSFTSARYTVQRVTTQNCNNGMQVISPVGTPSQACCGKIQTIMAIANNNAGLLIQDTGDTFVSDSEFENNGQQGVYLLNAGATRFAHNDVGGNKGVCALDIEGKSTGFNGWGVIVNGNQFGNNYAIDVCFNYSNTGNTQVNAITSNSFIGSANRASGTYYGIFGQNSAGNVIQGNAIFAGGTGHLLKYGVGIFNNTAGAETDSVTGNTNIGSFTSGGCALDSGIAKAGNIGSGC